MATKREALNVVIKQNDINEDLRQTLELEFFSCNFMTYFEIRFYSTFSLHEKKNFKGAVNHGNYCF